MKYWYKEKDWVYIGFNYNPVYVATMKEFGAFYNYATKEWSMQLGLESSILVKGFIEENGFIHEKPVLEREIPLNFISPIVDEKSLEDLLKYLKLPLNLRNYQIEGLAYMINHENCINGCSCGLGKSRQSIAYAELLNTFPCLIVCPSTVKTSWEKEWHRCNPKRTIHIIDSKDAENTDWKADVTIINYDFLYMRGKSTDAIKLRYRSLAKKWGLVIFDEIHLCKNEKALRSKAVKKIAKQAIHKIALSGTLITNRPKELINILEVLGKFKEIFPDKRYFLYRYCNARKTPFGVDANGASCTLELHEIIKHYCYFRKERREVLTELPPVVEQKINVPIANKKEYEKAEKDFIAYLSEIDIDAAERAERAEHLVRLSNLKRLSLKGKLKFIVQFLKDWQESDEDNKLIIFGIFTEPLEELYETFKKDAVLVTGKRTTTDEKMERIEQFKESKQFLFANIATLSTGVDGLQDHCSNMVFIEWPSTPKDLEQAQSRIDRMGQKKSMNIYHLLSDETVDLDIQELIKEKTIITNAVNRGIDSVSNSIKSLDWELLRRLKQKNEDPNKRLKT